jgi:hypothetical protein
MAVGVESELIKRVEKIPKPSDTGLSANGLSQSYSQFMLLMSKVKK